MPAFAEEVEAAIEEGVRIEPLSTPVKVLSENGRLTGIVCITNRLGDIDASGRRAPVPVPGSERTIPLDTLVVAISEGSDTDCVTVAGENRLQTTARSTVKADPETLVTNRAGVFAGGDVVTGPNTVVDAIAAGKRAALMIDRFLRGEPLRQPERARLPQVYVEPLVPPQGGPTDRVETPRLSTRARRRSFQEVEMVLSAGDASREAQRCLRCDLTFTEPRTEPAADAAEAGGRP
jgi:NADH-quinone oxidoreductase subunit F